MTSPEQSDAPRLYSGYAEPPAVIEKLFRELDPLPNPLKRHHLGLARTYCEICEFTYEKLIRELGLK